MASELLLPGKNQNIQHAEHFHHDSPNCANPNRPSFVERTLYAPFMKKDNWQWIPVLRSSLMELIGSTLLAWSVSIAVSTANSTTVGLNSLIIGVVYALMLITAYSWRDSTYLPRHLNPWLSLSEIFHSRIGIFVFLFYLVSQIGGSFLGGFLAWLMGGAVSANYATAARPVSGIAAIILLAAFSIVYVFSLMHNYTLDLHHYKMSKEEEKYMSNKNNLLRVVGGSVIVLSAIAAPSGLFTLGNPIVYLGPAAFVTGGYTTPSAGSWAIYAFAGAFGVLGWALHLVTWNMNDLSRSEIQMYLKEKKAKSAYKISQAMAWTKSIQ
jgi:glycerol uptake facilitator-like aquaporin